MTPTERVQTWIEGIPKGQPRPRFARIGKHVRTYTPPDSALISWRERIEVAMREYKPAAPQDGAFSLWLHFFFTRPPSHYGKKGLRKGAPVRHTSKPDLDNLAKGVLDELTQCGFWRDDAQVDQLSVSRVWTSGASGCDLRLERRVDDPSSGNENLGEPSMILEHMEIRSP